MKALSVHLPLSEYLMTEWSDNLVSKLAIKGATYWVAAIQLCK